MVRGGHDLCGSLYFPSRANVLSAFDANLIIPIPFNVLSVYEKIPDKCSVRFIFHLVFWRQPGNHGNIRKFYRPGKSRKSDNSQSCEPCCKSRILS